ncbi:ubiquitin [Colletotrichum sojae]|uniref:Ubiquitin n=1 Tax=Colletotrichum sojae TaxID=2175907 RepID=A0A8H6MY05_9PEZI|nr:ubiquitin [Colletotrichum sojae]
MAIICITFGERRRLIARPKSYQALVQKVWEVFDVYVEGFIIYLTSPTRDEEVELDPSAYDAISDGFSLRLTEGLDSSSDGETDNKQSDDLTVREVELDNPSQPELTNASGRGLDPNPFRTWVTALTTGADLGKKCEQVWGMPRNEQRICFEGQRMSDEDTPGALEAEPGNNIEVDTGRYDGKPAIFLMSPVRLDSASVQVTLSPHWKFSTIYPLVEPVLQNGNWSSVSWQVSADPNGTLKDAATGVECSYLYWEAKTTSDIPASPRVSSEYPFNPQCPDFSRMGRNACILPFSDFIPYLDRTLTMLTLSPVMRPEFMVYWLPKFQHIRDRGYDIAFDFVHQAAFEKVAKLSVDPQPQTVARIFLLFDETAKGGSEHLSLAELDAIDWPAKIGMDADGMRDQEAFRVLEWGGMQTHGF